MWGTMKTCALLTVMTVTVLAMNSRAHTLSCVTVEEHELAKRDLYRLNAEIWDLKAKYTATTEDMENLAEAAEKGKTYKGCPKCRKCPKRRLRHLLGDDQECVSPSTYSEHLALKKEIEIAKDKLKELKSEYNGVRSDFRSAKKTFCLCDPCHETTPATMAAPTTAAPTTAPPIPLNPCTGEEISLNTTELWIYNCDANMTLGIPSAFGLLSVLTELGFQDVPLLTGTMPTELGMLTKLEKFYHYGSSVPESDLFSGPIPTELGALTKLIEMVIYDVLKITGTLPTELGALTDLTWLSFSNMPLINGTLPTELGMLSKLNELSFYALPNIEGTIPTELNQLTLMTFIDISESGISASWYPGPFPPSELSALTLLEDCYDPQGNNPCL